MKINELQELMKEWNLTIEKSERGNITIKRYVWKSKEYKEYTFMRYFYKAQTKDMGNSWYRITKKDYNLLKTHER